MVMVGTVDAGKITRAISIRSIRIDFLRGRVEGMVAGSFGVRFISIESPRMGNCTRRKLVFMDCLIQILQLSVFLLAHMCIYFPCSNENQSK